MLQKFVQLERISAKLRERYTWYGSKPIGYSDVNEVIRKISSISTDYSMVDLASNYLYLKNGSELASIFAAIPEHIDTLSLCSNKLHMLPSEELALAFPRLPKNITTLNLSKNYFFLFKTDLAPLKGCLPFVKVLYVRYHDDISEKNDFKFYQELKAIFPNLEQVILSSIENSWHPINDFVLIGKISQNLGLSSVIPQTKPKSSLFISSPSANSFELINNQSDIWKTILSSLHASDAVNLRCTSRENSGFFQPLLTPKLVLTSVVEGNLAMLTKLVHKNPKTFFLKSDIVTPRGKKCFNVSAYQLMQYFRDKGMENSLMSSIPQELDDERAKQDAEIDSGGNDLVKIDFDPLKIKKEDFHCLREFQKTYILPTGGSYDLIFPLLENPNGIIYYPEADSFYYVDGVKEEIVKLNLVCDLNDFKNSFNAMENNSGRRSSDEEHQLIGTIMNRQLQRKGIRYELNGVTFKDSFSQFNIIPAYRKCLSLIEQAQINDNWEKVFVHVFEDLASTQGEELWVLQWLCEKFDSQGFKRGFEVLNKKGHTEVIFQKGVISDAIGSSFVIYKEGNYIPYALTDNDFPDICRYQGLYKLLLNDLVNMNRLIQDAKLDRLSPDPCTYQLSIRA